MSRQSSIPINTESIVSRGLNIYPLNLHQNASCRDTSRSCARKVHAAVTPVCVTSLSSAASPRRTPFGRRWSVCPVHATCFFGSFASHCRRGRYSAAVGGTPYLEDGQPKSLSRLII